MSIIKTLRKYCTSEEQLNFSNEWYRVYVLNLQKIDEYFIANADGLKKQTQQSEDGMNPFNYVLTNQIGASIYYKRSDPALYFVMYEHRRHASKVKYQESKADIYTKVDVANKKILQHLLAVYEDDDVGLLRVLLEKDKYGDNAFHNAHLYMPYLVNSVLFERLAKMHVQQHVQLFLTPNSAYRTIAHVWAIHSMYLSETCVKMFMPVLAEAMLKVDIYGKTPLHYLAQKPFSEMTQLFLEHIYDLEILRDIVSRQDKFGCTIYDYALRSGNYDLLNAITTRLGVSNQLYLSPNLEGATVFHNAIRNGHYDLVKELLRKLSADELKQLLIQKDKNKHTVLHMACHYADYNLLVLIFDLYRSIDLYHMRSELTHMEKLVKTNKKIVFNAYQELINHKMVLFDCYHYLINTYSDKENFVKRRDHFCSTLKALLNNKQDVRKVMLPQEDSSFFSKKYLGIFKGKERYHQYCLLMQYVTWDQIQEFALFIQNHYKQAAAMHGNNANKTLPVSAIIAEILLIRGTLERVQEPTTHAVPVCFAASELARLSKNEELDSIPVAAPVMVHASSEPANAEGMLYPRLR